MMTMRDPRWNEFLEALWLMDVGRMSAMVSNDPEVLHIRSGIGETPLHYLAVENRSDAVGWLHERRASIDTKNEFGTPVVFEVALLGYRDLLVWFLNHNVDLTATDENGDDIFAYLAEHGKQDMIDFLRSNLSRSKK